MRKEFIPYQQALALKELGFDEPCLKLWEKTIMFTLLVEPSEFKKVVSERYVKAPTFSQAFRWFREKYNVHSSPKRYDETKWWVEWGTWTSPVFETYEEAEFAWLNKLIEIVKQ